MNQSVTFSDLSPAEQQVAELYAWGLTQKEIANRCNKSVSTVNNQIHNVCVKTDTHKDTELAAWFFCSRFNISFDLSPIKRIIVTIFFLIITSLSIFEVNPLYIRVRTRTETRRKEI